MALCGSVLSYLFLRRHAGRSSAFFGRRRASLQCAESDYRSFIGGRRDSARRPTATAWFTRPARWRRTAALAALFACLASSLLSLFLFVTVVFTPLPIHPANRHQSPGLALFFSSLPGSGDPGCSGTPPLAAAAAPQVDSVCNCGRRRDPPKLLTSCPFSRLQQVVRWLVRYFAYSLLRRHCLLYMLWFVALGSDLRGQCALAGDAVDSCGFRAGQSSPVIRLDQPSSF